MVQPTPSESGTASRILALDALRGLAVIGIVWMNVMVFALPAQGYYNPIVWGPGVGEGSSLDRVIWIISFVFIEDKFRTLFAMLFGAGCLIVLERDHPGIVGARPWRGHYARMIVLFIIGIAHAVLFASNDVLRVYAIAGCALPFLKGLSANKLFAICIGLIAVHVGGGIIALGASVLDFYNGRTGSDAYLFAQRYFGANPAAVQFMLEQGREEWTARIARRTSGLGSQLGVIANGLPINLAAMALGMGLWKVGMLKGEWRLFVLQRCAAICAIVSIPALFALAWWAADNGFPASVTGMVGLVLSAPFDTALALAYAALAMAFFKNGGAAKLFAAAGRLSLTNYVMTSVILAAIFASWGGGLFGEVSRTQALVLSLVPIAAMLIWSPLLLRAMGRGPLEIIWRKASAIIS